MGMLRGINASGHLGWVTKNCTICRKSLHVGRDVLYTCSKCGMDKVIICSGDYKALNGKCPYCRSELVPLL
ncbi:MAG: hypothetical protein QXV93_02095 [Zestosphaera sp.]